MEWFNKHRSKGSRSSLDNEENSNRPRPRKGNQRTSPSTAEKVDQESSRRPAGKSGNKSDLRTSQKADKEGSGKTVQKSAQKRNIPSQAVTDMFDRNVEDWFDLRFGENKGDAFHLKSSERRRVPDYLRSALRDYDLAFGDVPMNEAIVRVRLNVILLTTLAVKKREEFGQYGREKQPNKRTSTDTADSYKSLHWALETHVSYNVTYKNKTTLVRGRMDYALWYGNRDEAETNMVVVEAKRKGSYGEGLHQALAYIGIIRSARKEAGRKNTTIWGIATDSWSWTFIRVDPHGQVLTQAYSWVEGESIEIISHLHKKMQHAACLSPAQSNTLSRQPIVEEISGLSFSPEEVD
ncbi:hypothetical protein BJY01DRAFT_244966 [Aspergillus pseudoustus]|uniref:Restriction endonuclease type II-like protein n=1 Tax=Aspergillus pseudoustus TaxID=1810923 RepID=A0ABR4KH59_9EURO